MKLIYLLITTFLIVVLQVSLIPNWQISGSMINLPLIFLAFIFHFSDEKSENTRQQILLLLVMGIFLDLLSHGVFLSSTLSLFTVVLLAYLFEKIVSFRDHLGLILAVVFCQVIIYNVVYYLLNRELSFQWVLTRATLIDAILTSIFFLLSFIVVEWFKRHFKRQDIKLMAR